MWKHSNKLSKQYKHIMSYSQPISNNGTPISNDSSSVHNNGSKCFYVMEDENLTPIIKIVYSSILGVTFLFIIISNLLLILGIRKSYRNKMTLSKKLFLFLSISDLFTGLITVPIQFSMVFYGSQATCFQVQLQAFFNTFTPALSMFTILTVSIVRYVSVVKPNFYKRNAHSRWIFAVLMVQFVLSAAMALWYVTATTRRHLGSFLIFVTLFCFAIIGSAVLLNIVLYIKLNSNSYSTTAVSNQKQKSYQKRVTKTIVLISVISSVSYLPNGIVFGLVGYFIIAQGSHLYFYQVYIPWVFLPMILNAGVNSVIYMWRDTKISRYLSMLILTTFRCSKTTEKVDGINLIDNNNFNHLRVSMKETSIHSGTGGGTSPRPLQRYLGGINNPGNVHSRPCSYIQTY